MTTVWETCKFPCLDARLDVRWPAKGKKLSKPYSWTPSRDFTFGGKRFIALYPCVAFETKNFGFVAQRLWDSFVIGRE